jgi:hypothetical protein
MKIRIRRPSSAPAAQSTDASASIRLLDAGGYEASSPVSLPALPPPSAAANLEAFLGRPPDKVNQSQIKGILRRLKVRLGEASAEAAALGIPFDGPLVHEVIDHLITETHTPGHTPFNNGSVRAWFIDGLFADLIQYPSNIFEIVTAADGTQNYLPLTPAAWALCLTKLKESLSFPDTPPG